MKTTLNNIRAYGPCTSGWSKLLKNLGKTQTDDEPVSIITILESNGLKDALWCLRATTGYDRELRLYAVWCARQVQHLMTDSRCLAAPDVAERFAHGEATDQDLTAARTAVNDATGDAGWSAAWATVVATTWSAACVTPWAAMQAGVAETSLANELRRVCLVIEEQENIK